MKKTRTFSASSVRNREIKKRLAKIFGLEFVKVRGGRGTAHGWVNIDVYVPTPADCFCNSKRLMGNGPPRDCLHCRETRDLAKRVVSKACEGLGFGTYYDDMGYGHSESITSVYLGKTA